MNPRKLILQHGAKLRFNRSVKKQGRCYMDNLATNYFLENNLEGAIWKDSIWLCKSCYKSLKQVRSGDRVLVTHNRIQGRVVKPTGGGWYMVYFPASNKTIRLRRSEFDVLED